MKKERNVLRSFAKEQNVLAFFYVLCKRTLRSLQMNVAFFYVLCKRTLRSLRSFSFFRKERKGTERSFGSHKSPKNRKKNGTFFLKNRKERNVPNGKECGAQPWVFIKDPYKNFTAICRKCLEPVPLNVVFTN